MEQPTRKALFISPQVLTRRVVLSTPTGIVALPVDVPPEVELVNKCYAILYPTIRTILMAFEVGLSDIETTIPKDVLWDLVFPNAPLLLTTLYKGKEPIYYEQEDLDRDLEEVYVSLKRSIFTRVNTGRKLQGISVSAIHSRVYSYLDDKGYMYSIDYGFIRKDHPFTQAMLGQLELLPEVFELGSGPWSVVLGDEVSTRLSGAMRDINLVEDEDLEGKLWDLTESGELVGAAATELMVDYISGMGFTVNNIRAILGILGANDKYDVPWWNHHLAVNAIIEEAHTIELGLNMELITGIEKDSDIPLPGFGNDLIDYRPMEAYNFIYRGERLSPNTLILQFDKLLHTWKRVRNRSYLQLIYRIVYDTIQYYNVNDACYLGLKTEYLVPIAEHQFGIETYSSEGSPLYTDRSTLCTVMLEEQARRSQIKKELLSSLPSAASEVILQPGSTWVMDAIGSLHLFQQRGFVVPDYILPDTLHEVSVLYQDLCSSTEPQPIGTFLYILHKLGYTDMDNYYQHIDKERLCTIINGLLRDKLKKQGVIKSGLSRYRVLCQNQGRHTLEEFLEAIRDLGLMEEYKTRICTWLSGLSLSVREKDSLQRLCKYKDQQSMLVMINFSQPYSTRRELESMACETISRYIESMELTYA